ncbi:hypothetical protein GGR54DRAFT_608148 [Hypoxylon sp. NC1633]|nr:hypothetical protein GGR54DRAFT_608148 [Hypoxylon sp. NC1633]
MTCFLFRRPLRAPRLTCYVHTVRRAPGTENGSNHDLGRSPNHTRPDTSGRIKISAPGGDVHPGAHVLSACRKHDISLPTALRRLSEVKLKKNEAGLGVMISEHHCFDMNSMKYLDKYEHPFAKSILGIYIAQKGRPLWYNAQSKPAASPFPCRVAAKRVKHAFRDALAAYGYDLEGRRASVDSSSVIRELYGTVKIRVADPKKACNMEFADLFKLAKEIVLGLEMTLARDKDGRLINSNQMPQQANKRPHRG